MNSSVTFRPVAGTGAQSVSKITAVVGAGLLGMFMILFIGFAPMAAMHNAVHDVRHSAAFPCH
jgi:cobalt transporter subunit CbtB